MEKFLFRKVVKVELLDVDLNVKHEFSTTSKAAAFLGISASGLTYASKKKIYPTVKKRGTKERYYSKVTYSYE